MRPDWESGLRGPPLRTRPPARAAVLAARAAAAPEPGEASRDPEAAGRVRLAAPGAGAPAARGRGHPRASGRRLELPPAASAAACRSPGPAGTAGVLRLRPGRGRAAGAGGRRPGRDASADRGARGARTFRSGVSRAARSPGPSRASRRPASASGSRACVLLVQTPFWAPLAAVARERFGWRVVYDCLDAHAEFSTNRPRALAEAEVELARAADIVAATSEPLRRPHGDAGARPRGCSPMRATSSSSKPCLRRPPARTRARSSVGYTGAIDAWFDMPLLERLAALAPDWRFEIVGGLRGRGARAPLAPNLVFHGERPHAEMPAFRGRFDVEIIPFRLSAADPRDRPGQALRGRGRRAPARGDADGVPPAVRAPGDRSLRYDGRGVRPRDRGGRGGPRCRRASPASLRPREHLGHPGRDARLLDRQPDAARDHPVRAPERREALRVSSQTDAIPVYDSARRRPRWIEEAGNLWRYRGLVHELVIRDIKVRYKRSVLGMLWTMLAPLLNMIALTLVFSAMLKTTISNYPVYFMAGQIFWSFFAQTSGVGRVPDAGLERPRQAHVRAALGLHRRGRGRRARQPLPVARAARPDPRGHRIPLLRRRGPSSPSRSSS